MTRRARRPRPRSSSAPPSVAVFGTFDERSHPRVQVLREGFEAVGAVVTVENRPLGVSTQRRVELLRRPTGAVRFGLTVLRRWAGLVRERIRRRGGADVVVVGYLGHFDVHLARILHRRSLIVLDHMVGLGDTAADRGLDGRRAIDRALAAVDRAALGAADVVLFDTEEHRRHLGAGVADPFVVPVGAPLAYHRAADAAVGAPTDGLRIVFFGLFTPLQGAPTIAEALRSLDRDDVRVTMIGDGQDRAATRSVLGDDPRVRWIDWVDAAELPGIIADHHVCLGIFGDSPKALRVVPNKVYQGAAAGSLVVTSDTPCQRSALHGAAVHVPPADPEALAEALSALSADPARVQELRRRSTAIARAEFSPEALVRPLLERLATR